MADETAATSTNEEQVAAVAATVTDNPTKAEVPFKSLASLAVGVTVGSTAVLAGAPALLGIAAGAGISWLLGKAFGEK